MFAESLPRLEQKLIRRMRTQRRRCEGVIEGLGTEQGERVANNLSRLRTDFTPARGQFATARVVSVGQIEVDVALRFRQGLACLVGLV